MQPAYLTPRVSYSTFFIGGCQPQPLENLVDAGFELAKPKQLIYSQPPLTAWVIHQTESEGFEPPEDFSSAV